MQLHKTIRVAGCRFRPLHLPCAQQMVQRQHMKARRHQTYGVG